MIAIIASVLLGLYVFLPEFLFKKLAFNFRVVTKEHHKGRFEEIFSGAGVSLLPFLGSLIAPQISWTVGHWPFPVEETVASKILDYRTVVSALCSDQFFHEHLDATWIALDHVRLNQLRFLFWNYCFLAVEIIAVYLLTHFFGSLSRYAIYRWTFGRILLGRASEWELLLTGFAFPKASKVRVAVDALTTDDHLYSGTVFDYFLNEEGNLSGLLLKDLKRFGRSRFEEDRKAGLKPDSRDYWAKVPGANFYLPGEKLANLNIRYETPPDELIEDVKRLLKSMDLGDSIVSIEKNSDAKPDLNG
jgi:hypothetical protein